MANAGLARRTARSLDRDAHEPPQRSERRFSRTKSDPRSGGSRNTSRNNALPPIESANSLDSNNKDVAKHGPCGPGTNIYGKVLGQTADETILVGIQMFKKIGFAQSTSPDKEGSGQTSSTADTKKNENDRQSSQRTNQDRPSHDDSKDRRIDRNELDEHYSEEEISDNHYEEGSADIKSKSEGSRRESVSNELLANEVDYGGRGGGSIDLEAGRQENRQESFREFDNSRRIGSNGSEDPFMKGYSDEGTGKQSSFGEEYSDEELKHESSQTENIDSIDQQFRKKDSEISNEGERISHMESQTESERKKSIVVEEYELMANSGTLSRIHEHSSETDLHGSDSPEETSSREVDSPGLNSIQASKDEDLNEIHENLQRSVESRVDNGRISSSPGSSLATHNSFHTHDSFDVPAVNGSHVSHDIHSSFDTNENSSQHSRSNRGSHDSRSVRLSSDGSGIHGSQHSRSIRGSHDSQSVRGSHDSSGIRGSNEVYSSGEGKDILMSRTVVSSAESGGHSSRSGSKQSPLSSEKTSAKSGSSDSSPSIMRETRHSDSSRSAGSIKSNTSGDRPVKEASRTSRGSSSHSSGSKQLKSEDSVKSVISSKSVDSKRGYDIQSETLVNPADSRSGGSQRNSNKDLSKASEDVKLQLNRSQKEVDKPKRSNSILKDSSSSSKSKSDTSGSISCTCSYTVSSPEKTEKASREQLSKLNSCSCCSCSKEKIEVCPARKSCFKAAQKICDICCRDSESSRTVLEIARTSSQKKVRLCCDCSTSTSSCLTPGLADNSALMQKGDGYGLQGKVRYSITKITDYGEFTTFEIMKSTRRMPKTMPTSLEGVFVLRKAASRT